MAQHFKTHTQEYLYIQYILKFSVLLDKRDDISCSNIAQMNKFFSINFCAVAMILTVFFNGRRVCWKSD